MCTGQVKGKEATDAGGDVRHGALLEGESSPVPPRHTPFI